MTTSMSLDRLRALHAIAQHGSVAAAAEALHVTPSGVSQQLGKLERETGHRLLEPAGRGIRLTRAGHVLAEHAARVLAQVTAAQTDLDRLRDDITGPVRIGSVQTAARVVLPPALTDLRTRHPALSPTLDEGEAENLLPALIRGDLDVALIESWITVPTEIPAAVTHRTLLTDTIDVALPAHHPLARRRTAGLAELTGTAWASWPGGTTCDRQLVQTLRDHHIDPEITCRVADYPTQLAFVAAGLAAALLPRLGRGPLPEGVRIVATQPPITSKVQVCWRAGASSLAIDACVEAFAAAASVLSKPTTFTL